MNIHFEEITLDNFYECVDLKVSKEQEVYLPHSNAVSIAESKFHNEWATFGIYNDNIMIGFSMYGPDDEEDEFICLIRFMIDERYQGKGCGREALRLLLDMIKNDTGCSKIYLSFHPDNIVTKKLYMGFGFRQFITGLESDDEVFYELIMKR